MQSSLPYLLTALIARKISGSKALFVYDIHDLNERTEAMSRYEAFRFYCMFVLEWIAFKSSVRLLTVSRGLAHIYRLRYGIRPVVVRNIPEKTEAVKVPAVGQVKEGLVYFGLIDKIRLPEKFLEQLESGKVQLDIFGKLRERSPSYLRKLNELERRGVVRLRGEYDPSNLTFLTEYRASVLPFDVCEINLRYSLPNKLFQSLEHRVPCLIAPKLIEAKWLFRDWPRAVVSLDSIDDLERFIRNEPGPSTNDWGQVDAALDTFRAEDEKHYARALRTD